MQKWFLQDLQLSFLLFGVKGANCLDLKDENKKDDPRGKVNRIRFSQFYIRKFPAKQVAYSLDLAQMGIGRQ